MKHPHDDDPNGDRHRYGYDRNQPRVPAGRHGGGQWTRGGSGPQELAVRLAFLDRTDPLRRIQSPPLAPTARPPISPKPGLSIEKNVWIFVGSLLLQLWLDGEADQQPALVFKSRDYRKSALGGTWRLHSMELLDEKEIQEICGEDQRIGELQKRLDETAEDMGFGGGKRISGPEGTEAHQRMKKALDAIKGRDTEILIARNEKTGKFEEVDRKDNPKDSVRLDFRVWNGKPTVCVEDHKFGERGLDLEWINNLVVKAAEAYPDATRILIFEGRPTKTPRQNPE